MTFALLLCASAPLREFFRFLAVTLAMSRFGLTYAEEQADAAAIRAAAEKSLPLLQAGAKSFRERSEGRRISFHHQGLVLQTIAQARRRGVDVDEGVAREEGERVHGFYVPRREGHLAGLSGREAITAPRAAPVG